MLLLEKNRYEKVKASLTAVKINHLFALSVVENRVTGSIYVDRQENPGTFYVVHPYGMSLLFGSAGNAGFNTNLLNYMLNTSGVRNKAEWLQAFPDTWNKKLRDWLGNNLVRYGDESDNQIPGKVIENTRVNFKFNKTRYLELKKNIGHSGFNIERVNADLFNKMQGTVVPRYFWNSADDFCKHGAGFCVVIGGQPVSLAYSAYITDKQLELGIETSEEYRGKGLALHVCFALIDYCLKNHYEPVWSCRFENTGSYILAQKLGFEPTIILPYYKLP